MEFLNQNTPIHLVNGVNIPCIGYGTWQTPAGEVAAVSVRAALEAGYRHIDAASAYGKGSEKVFKRVVYIAMKYS